MTTYYSMSDDQIWEFDAEEKLYRILGAPGVDCVFAPYHDVNVTPFGHLMVTVLREQTEDEKGEYGSAFKYVRSPGRVNRKVEVYPREGVATVQG